MEIIRVHNLPSPLVEPTLRNDLPVYPPLIQLLRVTPATVPGPAGVAQTAGSSVLGPTLYIAFTQQLRTDALLPRDREPCLVDDVNDVIRGNPGFPGFYLGRLAGTFNSLPVYEVCPSVATTTSTSTSTVRFSKCLDADGVPNADGTYDGRIQDHNADGTLADTGASVWMREAQTKNRLFTDIIYPVQLTGNTNGRDVWTVCDFTLLVSNADYSVYESFCHIIEFWPLASWTVEIHPLVSRGVRVYRKFDVYEGSTLRMDNTKKIVFKSDSDIRQDDFDLTAGAASSGDIDEIALAGFTGDVDVLVKCEEPGILKKRILVIRRGSIKDVTPISDA